jgi:hypothetical protein
MWVEGVVGESEERNFYHQDTKGREKRDKSMHWWMTGTGKIILILLPTPNFYFLLSYLGALRVLVVKLFPFPPRIKNRSASAPRFDFEQIS